MHQARRGFLRVAVTVAAAAAVGAAQDQQQDQQQDTRTRIPGSSANKDPFGPDGRDAPKLDPHAVMKANQETVKKDVARMAELTQQLQKELENSDSKDVLSLDVLHKSEEIERLAKQVKDLIRS
jgi:hypothetical protein